MIATNNNPSSKKEDWRAQKARLAVHCRDRFAFVECGLWATRWNEYKGAESTVLLSREETGAFALGLCQRSRCAVRQATKRHLGIDVRTETTVSRATEVK